MTDRPMLFSAPMIHALLADRKIQTRRMLKPQPGELDRPFMMADGSWHVADSQGGHMSQLSVRVRTGDRLWVKETHAIVGSLDPGWVMYRANGYRAECERHGFDKPFPPENAMKWRPSIFMPRWASRLSLLVTDVRIERLQDISEEDSVAEGCIPDSTSLNPNYIGPAKSIYAALWDTINARRAPWQTNPWVVAYTFDVIKANIDQVPQ